MDGITEEQIHSLRVGWRNFWTGVSALVLLFSPGEEIHNVFLCLAAFFLIFDLSDQGKETYDVFFSTAAFFLSNRSLSSGESDSRFLLCVSALVCKILIFFSRGRSSRCFLCPLASLHRI
jgi:hypothetical protein